MESFRFFQSVLVWRGTSSESQYLNVSFLLIVLRMRGRTHVATGQCFLGYSLHSGTDGPLGKGPHPFLQESGFTFLGFLPLSVRCITFKFKAEDDSLKTPPGTIQTGICPCRLALISTFREPSGIGMYTIVILNPFKY